MEQIEIARPNRQNENIIYENMRANIAHKYLGVGLSTLWLWVKQGKIKAYKISDRVTIFKRSELDAFVNGEVS
jgi:excisionase family DNA binding protein